MAQVRTSGFDTCGIRIKSCTLSLSLSLSLSLCVCVCVFVCICSIVNLDIREGKDSCLHDLTQTIMETMRIPGSKEKV